MSSLQRARLYARSQGFCEACGKPLYEGFQLAHVIPQTKHNLKKYGKEVIHHDLNLKVVCSLKCNSAVLKNLATHPVEGQELIEKIKKEINL